MKVRDLQAADTIKNAKVSAVRTFFCYLLHFILVGIVKIVIANPLQFDILRKIKYPMLFAPTHCGKNDGKLVRNWYVDMLFYNRKLETNRLSLNTEKRKDKSWENALSFLRI